MFSTKSLVIILATSAFAITGAALFLGPNPTAPNAFLNTPGPNPGIATSNESRAAKESSPAAEAGTVAVVPETGRWFADNRPSTIDATHSTESSNSLGSAIRVNNNEGSRRTRSSQNARLVMNDPQTSVEASRGEVGRQGFSPPVGASAQATEIRPPQLPTVLQNLNGAILTPQQAAVVTKLQNDFIQQVGGQNQNPHDPAYLQRWQTAEHDAYDKLRAVIGDTAANQLQVIAAQNANSAGKL